MRILRAVVLLTSLAACGPAVRPSHGVFTARCLVADSSTASPDTIYAIATLARHATVDCEHRAMQASDVPVVVVVTPPATVDMRDVLEGGAASTRRPDVVVTSDPQLIDLARRSAGFIVTPLAWTTTYALIGTALDSTTSPSAGERDAIARDAVVADARGAVEPFPWRNDPACTAPVAGSRTSVSPVVAYAAGDRIARSLGERVLSLLGSASRPAWLSATARRPGVPLRLAAVPRDSVASVRQAFAIVAIARDPSTPCGTRDNAPVRTGTVPLIDAREHAIVRRGSGASFIVASDGSLHFVKRGVR